jgi:hypothetical protein
MPAARHAAKRVSRFVVHVTPWLRKATPALAELAGAALLVTAAYCWLPLVGLAAAGVVLLAAANARP